MCVWEEARGKEHRTLIARVTRLSKEDEIRVLATASIQGYADIRSKTSDLTKKPEDRIAPEIKEECRD